MELLSQLRAGLAGRYAIERELGRGGMATVYLAQDLQHRRPVALKVLAPELAAALGTDRFRREIEVAAGLHHPHILPLFDSGEAAGCLFYTMPVVEGESLRARLERETQLPVEDAVQIAREVADALAYAHSRGVVHRDIKPENILLENGHALLGDFGIARAMDAAEEAGRLTATGIAIGTPAYMSPEQASAERRIDGRSDVYSLGCVLYEMLAGEPPYTGPTAQAIAARRLAEPPRSLRIVRDAVPIALESAVMKSLARIPADRWATAAQFAGGLEPGAPDVGPRPGPGRRRKLLLPAVGLAVLGALAVVAPSVGRALRRLVGGPMVPRLAVLPFDNLGPADEQYFTDGISDEVRGKLTLLPGLTVIARASSVQYRQTTKPPQEIGRELGATYLLTGTVRWEKHPDGTSLVHVSPELIRVSDAAASWEEGFDAPLTDVFQVQAGIAIRVAQALDVVLGAPEQQRLAARPTKNLAAYDAFLQGEEISDRLGSVDPVTMVRAIGFYARAVQLDSGFALAWARLGVAHALHHTYDNSDSTEAGQSRAAAERAVAFAPALPEAHMALAMFYTLSARDFPSALAEWDRAQRLIPGPNAEVANGRGLTEQFMGQWEASARDLGLAHSLDPRSAATSLRLTRALLWLRRYPDALRVSDSGLLLAPTNLALIHERTEIFLAQGDLTGARAVLRAVPARVDRRQLIALLLTVGDLYWVLDDGDQQLLLTQPADSFDLDAVTWALGRAEVYAVRGDRLRSLAYADSARILTEGTPGGLASNAGVLLLHGLSLALLGHLPEAAREEAQVQGFREVRNGFGGKYSRLVLVRVNAMAGQRDSAFAQLASLLREPFYVAPGWLRIDPGLAPLRGDPRFERLTRGAAP